MNQPNAPDDPSHLPFASLVSRAKRDPVHILAQLDLLLSAAAPQALTGEDLLFATWAKGVALFEMGRNSEAIEALTQVVASDVADIRDRAAISLAAAEAAAGATADAITRLEGLTAGPDPVVQALAGSQLGLLHLHRGELHRSLQLLELSLPVLRSEPTEEQALARVLNNVGTCQMLLGQMQASTQPLQEAIEIASRTGQTLALAAGLQNLGYAEARLGSTDRAIEHMERARQVYAEMGNSTRRNLATLFEDLSETYRFAGLAHEALRYARLAAWAVRDGDNVEKQTDADYQRARCLLEGGNPTAARTCAVRTRAAYIANDRPLWARRAESLILETAMLGEPVSIEDVALAQQGAEELAAAGWNVEAQEMRVRLAELLIADDQPDAALHILTLVATPEPDTPTLQWLEQCFAEALRLHVRGRPIEPALSRAWTRLRDLRAEITDPELRLGAARLTERFRALGLARAIADEDAAAALASETSWRALAGRWHTTARTSPGVQPSQRSTDASTVSTAAEVHVHWATTGDRLYRIEVRDGLASLTACGSYDDVVVQAAKIRRSIARLARPGLSPNASLVLARALVEECAEIGDCLGVPSPDVAVVLAPPGELVELPWRLIAPGATVRTPLGHQDAARPTNRVDSAQAALLLGPGLEHGDRDIAAFRAVFPQGKVVRDGQATVAMLGELMETSSFLHVAAHGRFRSDSPRHSRIEMVDGSAMLHQVDQLEAVPAVVVLAVCEAARGETRTGGDRRGATTSLLDAGADCVIAPICSVPDRELADVFGRFYAALPGRSPDAALAAVGGRNVDFDPRQWATAHATQYLASSSVLPVPNDGGAT